MSRPLAESLKLLSDVTSKMLAYNFIASCVLAMRATRALRLVETMPVGCSEHVGRFL